MGFNTGTQSVYGQPTGFNAGMRDSAMLHQPMPSRPTTNYLDIPIPTTRSSPDNFGDGSGSPSDAELERAVHDILRSADLNSVTKREIRRQLEDQFGVDLTSRKAVINAAIDRVLLSQT